ncbi:MAG: hypothetical protein CFE26_18830 [Verrucomicrobiales bacterium VVV1]|nr:MAG: hypothetical protein CFE26_18830 [Verrucomicrobiales bacterium VVV1]
MTSARIETDELLGHILPHKLYTPEADSSVFRDFLANSGDCVTSDLTLLEFWATVRRKESDGVLAEGQSEEVFKALQADVEQALIRMIPSDISVREEFHSIIERCYSRIPAICIRTNDALHLAAARCAGEMEIIATDKRLRETAGFLGFTIFPVS